jgi:YfiH family protein
MIKKKMDSLEILFFENLPSYGGITHFISTRNGGFSKAPYHSLNLGLHVGDDPEKVLKNRRRLAAAIGIPLNQFTIAEQVHSGNVRIILDETRGSGSKDYGNSIKGTDAMVTNKAGICLVILVADCVPMLFFDPVQGAIGVAHAGWRGTLKCIAQNTVRTLETAFGSSPRDIVVGIGPSIGPCCYSVGSEVIRQFENTFPTTKEIIVNKSDDGTGYVDLWLANLKQLLHSGIERNNIELVEVCTRDNSDRFFSYRQQNGDTGRFGAGITLVPS